MREKANAPPMNRAKKTAVLAAETVTDADNL